MGLAPTETGSGAKKKWRRHDLLRLQGTHLVAVPVCFGSEAGFLNSLTHRGLGRHRQTRAL